MEVARGWFVVIALENDPVQTATAGLSRMTERTTNLLLERLEGCRVSGEEAVNTAEWNQEVGKRYSNDQNPWLCSLRL